MAEKSETELPEDVSLQGIDGLLGLSPTVFCSMSTKGQLPRTSRRGFYNLKDSVQAMLAHLRSERRNAHAIETGDAATARARLTNLKVDLAQIELDKASGKLVSIDEVV